MLVLKKGIQSLFPLHPIPSYFCFFAVLAPQRHGIRHATVAQERATYLLLGGFTGNCPSRPGELLLPQTLSRNCLINKEGEASLEGEPLKVNIIAE